MLNRTRGPQNLDDRIFQALWGAEPYDLAEHVRRYSEIHGKEEYQAWLWDILTALLVMNFEQEASWLWETLSYIDRGGYSRDDYDY